MLMSRSHIMINTIFFDELASTNVFAIDLLAKSNPIEGTVISTYNQSVGKGQFGRKWYSGTNSNISLSLILRPTFLSIKENFYLSIMLSLAVREYIASHLTKSTVKIKWPNDIYVNNDKIAGLLIQNTIMGKSIVASIMGVGLNVNELNFPSVIPNPISIIQKTGKELILDEEVEKLLDYIVLYYTRLKQGDLLGLKKDYLHYLYRRGEIAKFYLGEKETIDCEIVGIGDSGKLVLNHKGDLIEHAMNEIRMIIDD